MSTIWGAYHSAIYDSIDIVHFLVVKKIGLTGEIDNFCNKTTIFDWSSIYHER